MKLELRNINKDDFEDLLEWSNDYSTRVNSINGNNISREEHGKYMEMMINNPMKSQYVLLVDGAKVGTIKYSDDGDLKELSYTIAPIYRNLGLSNILMRIFLYGKKGKFLCRIRTENIASIKLVNSIGFNLWKTENDIHFYILNKIL